MASVMPATDPAAAYAERARRREPAVDAWLRARLARLRERVLPGARRLRQWVSKAGRLEREFAAFDDLALTQVLRASASGAYSSRETSTVRALAAVRELARRTLGKRPHDCQLLGVCGLLSGRFIEMDTGEGKTLTAGLAATIAAVARVPVHVVTVNDYLAERDAQTLAPLYAALGLRVGSVRGGLSLAQRREAYACHVTYCTNKELVFDYLKDRVAAGPGGGRLRSALRELHGLGEPTSWLLRGLCFAIVDEGDSVLIDEARTPLILSQAVPGEVDEAAFRQALTLAGALQAPRDFTLSTGGRDLRLTEAGLARVDGLAAHWRGGWRVAQARRRLVEQALRALHLFRRDEHYLVVEGKVQIVDEYTGRVLEGRKWEQGLHPLIELKEGCALSEPVRTVAGISYQRFFRKYLRLAAMSGTAREVALELRQVYELPYLRVPPNRPNRRHRLPDRLLPDAAAKSAAIIDAVRACQARGQAVLIGTRSVGASEAVSAALAACGIAHRTLNARQDADEAALIAAAGQPGAVTVATNMAGRGTDIELADGVRAAGGLHVLLTEFHTSSRIDRQLFGRCARQGDPGTCQAVVAWDDDLFVRHGGLLRRALVPWRWLLPQTWAGAWLRAAAQRDAELGFARTRRQTMRHDETLERTLGYAANGL